MGIEEVGGEERELETMAHGGTASSLARCSSFAVAIASTVPHAASLRSKAPTGLAGVFAGTAQGTTHAYVAWLVPLYAVMLDIGASIDVPGIPAMALPAVVSASRRMWSRVRACRATCSSSA